MKNQARVVRTSLRWQVAVKDRAFDSLYPEEVRRLASLHWTPVAVALRAAAWLAPEAGARVLDVGSGPGKVCCIGALAQGGNWHGVERDSSLVDVANATAALLDVEQMATFRAGEMDLVDWREFDSIYFFNPFAAILFGPAPFDEHVRWSMLTEQIARTEARLAELQIGTRVVTYQGFGGDMPDGYALAQMELIGDAQLVLWIKQRATRRSPPEARVGA